MAKEMGEEGPVEHQQHAKDYVDPPPAPLLDLKELKRWSFYRALIAEFMATLLFLYVSVATVIGYKSQADACDGVGFLGVAWAFGGMIFILVYCIAGISGTYILSHYIREDELNFKYNRYKISHLNLLINYIHIFINFI